MNETTIRETCSCGASFEMSAEYIPALYDAVKDWRNHHRHNPTATDPEFVPVFIDIDQGPRP